MSYAAYRAGIASIAAQESEGEDVEDRIEAFALEANVSAETVRTEVNEAQG